MSAPFDRAVEKRAVKNTEEKLLTTTGSAHNGVVLSHDSTNPSGSSRTKVQDSGMSPFTGDRNILGK
ncbi:hypothetical protein ZHAS_00011997 [Anopheles sinensis]|uniref:Uncharacterized protein n=1 Tax=Anopheles sinensis TaxID=74873 RepID=A0A084W1L2_ANOSI|nr:hypothetical protein ZHAS_00011997 [Anopheles sinensis]